MGRVVSTGLLIAILWVSGCAADLSRHRRHREDCPPCDGPDEAPRPGNFNFYFLVRQWGPEFCHKGCTVQPDPNQFTLHGLWPNLDNPCTQDYPEHCETVAFEVDQIPDATYDRMLKDWPSYKKSNACFWAHEWDCHGSCSGLEQAEYFKTVLDLHEQYDIKAALDAEDIHPSADPIPTKAVIAAISKHFGVDPILHCSRGGGKTFLNEVFLPVDKDFNIVKSSTVCQAHPCVPSEDLDRGDFCEDELIYKVPYKIDPEEPEECDDDRNLCKEKSGTCKPDRRGHGSQQDMLDASDTS